MIDAGGETRWLLAEIGGGWFVGGERSVCTELADLLERREAEL